MTLSAQEFVTELAATEAEAARLDTRYKMRLQRGERRRARVCIPQLTRRCRFGRGTVCRRCGARG